MIVELDLLDSFCAANKLHYTIFIWASQSLIKCERKFDIYLLKQCVHNREELDDELVLSHVVTDLEYSMSLSNFR